MTKLAIHDIQKRLREIEDRKIAILLETGRENARYSGTISQLNSEYKALDEEYYQLKMEVIKIKRKQTGISSDNADTPAIV